MVEVLGVDQQVLSSALRAAGTTHLAAGRGQQKKRMLLDSGEKDVNKKTVRFYKPDIEKNQG